MSSAARRGVRERRRDALAKPRPRSRPRRRDASIVVILAHRGFARAPIAGHKAVRDRHRPAPSPVRPRADRPPARPRDRAARAIPAPISCCAARPRNWPTGSSLVSREFAVAADVGTPGPHAAQVLAARQGGGLTLRLAPTAASAASWRFSPPRSAISSACRSRPAASISSSRCSPCITSTTCPAR